MKLLEALLRFSIRHRWAVLVLTLVVAAVGVWSAPASYGSCFRIQLSASAADEP